jgi:hypothetical protein
VVLTGATPVIVAIESLPTAAKAAPVALAAILAGVGLVAGWRDNYLRWTAAELALREELVRLQTRSSPYGPKRGEGELVALFVANVSRILEHETTAWRETFRGEAPGRSLPPDATPNSSS